jgi:S-disulfanyl-L-cysteine oxidoreductase SoxD
LRTHYPLNKNVIVAIVACGLFIALEVVTAQAPRSLWDGIYTQEQAKRGEAAYVEKCARCHGAQLIGGDMNPPLVGPEFLSLWNTKTVGDLFDRIRTTMPQDKPGSVTRQQDADIVAYLLNENKFPAGKTELESQTELLKQIQFDAFKQ